MLPSFIKNKQTDEENAVFLDLGAFEALLLAYGNNLRLFRNGFFNASYKINLSHYLLLFFFPYLTVKPHLTDEGKIPISNHCRIAKAISASV